MGGGGGILSPITNTLFGSPQTVDTPNYSQAAQQTAAGNLANAQATTQANRVNQNTPYTNLNYVQGTDANGNPTWTANQTATPQLGSAINSNLGQLSSTYSQGYQAPSFSTGGDLANMGYYGSKLNAQQLNPNSLNTLPQYNVNTQINQGQLPSYGIDPGQSYTDAIMQRLQPSLTRQSASSDVQLANQGIMPGSEAYNRAKTLQSQSLNDQLTSAIVGGMQTGLQANTAQNQTAANIKSLSSPGYITPYSQAATTGPDYTGAYATSNAADIAARNAQLAKQNNLTSGLFQLGTAGILGSGGLSGLASGIGGAYNGIFGNNGLNNPFVSSSDYMNNIGAVSSGTSPLFGANSVPIDTGVNNLIF